MPRGLVRELLYRRVPQIGGIYLAGGWGLLEFTSWAEERAIGPAGLPDLIVALWLAAFPVVLALAWRFGAPGPQHGPHKDPEQSGKSVAVLPFENLSDDPENAYLADGLADEITSALTKVQGLSVASRTSAFAHRGAAEDVREIGHQLGVGAVLEGSVQRSGNRLRVTTQLVDVGNGYSLWSDHFDRDMEDVFRIQDEIAANVAHALELILAASERRALAKVPTSDVRAYEFYLRGRQFLYGIRRKSLEYAREMFERAIEIDPEYAMAYAGLADAHSILCIFYPESQAELDAADRASQRALELDPELAEAHSARGTALSLMGQDDAARAALETALDLDPRLYEAHYFYARICFQAGEFKKAADLFEEAYSIREDYNSAFFAAQSYEAMNDPQAAQEAYDTALKVAEQHMELNPDDPRAATMRAVSLCRIGEKEEGLHWAERALEIDPEDAGIRYNAACLYAVEGRPDQALNHLAAAIRRGFGNPRWLARDPDMDPLRDDPRFQALMAGMEERNP
jgi:TolB-like protein/thioredoxin-like negative regulator of GroEL